MQAARYYTAYSAVSPHVTAGAVLSCHLVAYNVDGGVQALLSILYSHNAIT